MTDGTSQGLFVIVAVIIFGIFVAIAYNLFGDKLKLSLASIFSDSFTQAENALNGGGTGDVEAPEEMENLIPKENENGVSYVLLREAYDEHSNIYATFVENETGGVTITGVSKEADGEYRGDNISESPLGLTGEISFNKQIDGKYITEIEGSVFELSLFTGDFNAPKLIRMHTDAFVQSEFNGVFNAPEIEYLNPLSFQESTFTGDFNAPKLTYIGGTAFANSTFSGTFNAPKVTSIGPQTFANSTFSGTFNAPELTYIGGTAFKNSTFSGTFNAPKVTNIGGYAFANSTFTSATAPIAEVKISISIGNKNLEDLLKQTP